LEEGNLLLMIENDEVMVLVGLEMEELMGILEGISNGLVLK
jgi:hypothetical protein